MRGEARWIGEEKQRGRSAERREEREGDRVARGRVARGAERGDEDGSRRIGEREKRG